jgi:hypothetical protein
MQPLLEQLQVGDVIDHRHEVSGFGQHRGVQIGPDGLTVDAAQREAAP